MADPAKFKSVSVSTSTYKILKFLSDGKITDADLTVSKTIESLAKKESKRHGYKNGKGE
jgi:pterin-4a-carbinolamine dehydratase